jgi:RNA polymerase sigma-70 factor (ECF subfamily)
VNAQSDDQQDWTDALAGDGEAFGRIFDRHRHRVFRHAYGLLGAVADADDAVSIAFLEAWRRADGVRFVERSMLPWLLVTATNASRNLARSGRRYRNMLSRLPADAHSEDRYFDLSEGDALSALHGLSPTDQRILTLCVLEQLSEKDAAAVLRIPAGTVKSRLSRAKARLANQLTPRAKEIPNEQ